MRTAVARPAETPAPGIATTTTSSSLPVPRPPPTLPVGVIDEVARKRGALVSRSNHTRTVTLSKRTEQVGSRTYEVITKQQLSGEEFRYADGSTEFAVQSAGEVYEVRMQTGGPPPYVVEERAAATPTAYDESTVPQEDRELFHIANTVYSENTEARKSHTTEAEADSGRRRDDAWWNII